MSLRITAGYLKNRKLDSVKGKGLRPISERMKLALFSIIGSQVEGADFLDLFAGTGNIAFEAVSRGAAHAVMVEKASRNAGIIRNNAGKLGVTNIVETVHSDVFDYMPQNKKFDIIFAGPPYRANLGNLIISHCGKNRLLKDEGILIIQHHKGEIVDGEYYNKYDSRRYGLTVIDFFSIQ